MHSKEWKIQLNVMPKHYEKTTIYVLRLTRREKKNDDRKIRKSMKKEQNKRCFLFIFCLFRDNFFVLCGFQLCFFFRYWKSPFLCFPHCIFVFFDFGIWKSENLNITRAEEPYMIQMFSRHDTNVQRYKQQNERKKTKKVTFYNITLSKEKSRGNGVHVYCYARHKNNDDTICLRK